MLTSCRKHAVIHTEEIPPQELPGERLSLSPIKITREQEGPEGQLTPQSRINFAKLYTIEMYTQVLNVGKVSPNFINTLTEHANMAYIVSSLRPGRQSSKFTDITNEWSKWKVYPSLFYREKLDGSGRREVEYEDNSHKGKEEYEDKERKRLHNWRNNTPQVDGQSFKALDENNDNDQDDNAAHQGMLKNNNDLLRSHVTEIYEDYALNNIATHGLRRNPSLIVPNIGRSRKSFKE